MTYEIVWEFRVPPQNIGAFETGYGSQGPWAQLFSRAPGFLEVRLLRCTDEQGRYLTIDRWASSAAFEAFKQALASDYARLDQELEGLAHTETRIGAFDVG